MRKAHGYIHQITSTLFTRGTCVHLSRTGPNSSDTHTRRETFISPAPFPTSTDSPHSSHLKPGGWVELQELRFEPQCDDETMKDDYVIAKFLRLVKEGLGVLGVDLFGMTKNAQMLRDAGFVNVEEKVFKIPLGAWPKNKTMKLIGLYLRSAMYDGLQAVSLGPLVRGLKWTTEEVEVFLISIRKALFDSSVHAYLPFHIVYGQKPVEE